MHVYVLKNGLTRKQPYVFLEVCMHGYEILPGVPKKKLAKCPPKCVPDSNHEVSL